MCPGRCPGPLTCRRDRSDRTFAFSERRRALSRIEANGAVRDLHRRDIELLSFGPFADRVWELRHEMSVHDAWHVAVAETFGLRLATLDRGLRRAAGARCRFAVAARWRGGE